MSEESQIDVYKLPEFDIVVWQVKDFYVLINKGGPQYYSPSFDVRGRNCQIKALFENDLYISLILRGTFRSGPVLTSGGFLIKVRDTWIATKKCEKYWNLYGWYNYTAQQFLKTSGLEKSFRFKESINSNSVKPDITAADAYSVTIVCLITGVDRQCDVLTKAANLNDSKSDLGKLDASNKFSNDETGNGSKELRNNQGVENLSNNLKELYLNKEHCDIKIKVGSKEFFAHKVILSARSPAFASMFRHEMTENLNGTLDISDCEPEIFEIFLKFLYSGKMDAVFYNNAIGLYKTADKYSVDDLKEECVSCLCERIETEYICDILVLAAVHEEAKLLEIAINFFIENVKDIFFIAKWQKFMIENTALANECFKKMVENKL